MLVDIQHAPVDYATLAACITAINAAGKPALVRVEGPHDRGGMQQALDLGAAGLMVPTVNTAADVERCVAAMYYPSEQHPTGNRSIAWPIRPQLGRPVPEYLSAANDEVALLVQCETKQCYDGLESVLSVPGVDCCFVGPVDLSHALGFAQSQGFPACFDSPDFKAALEHVVAVCRAKGVTPGNFAVTEQKAQEMLDLGFPLLATGTDVGLMGEAAARNAAVCREHATAAEVDRDGVPSRFCQQCGRFHELAAFDGHQRSCREQLAYRSKRRKQLRQQQQESGGDGSSGAASSAAEGEHGRHKRRAAKRGVASLVAAEASGSERSAAAAAAAASPWGPAPMNPFAQPPPEQQQQALQALLQQQEEQQQQQQAQAQQQAQQQQQQQQHAADCTAAWLAAGQQQEALYAQQSSNSADSSSLNLAQMAPPAQQQALLLLLQHAQQPGLAPDAATAEVPALQQLLAMAMAGQAPQHKQAPQFSRQAATVPRLGVHPLLPGAAPGAQPLLPASAGLDASAALGLALQQLEHRQHLERLQLERLFQQQAAAVALQQAMAAVHQAQQQQSLPVGALQQALAAAQHAPRAVPAEVPSGQGLAQQLAQLFGPVLAQQQQQQQQPSAMYPLGLGGAFAQFKQE
ncbi:2,4-dihydroxyhept-2-ene-1,7-dioic acid aldolase [Micractinium conductrix]|uniref:2,4-dihydroxyhept-2-ene-1,7-dioic acid aldolase n=1 Tax=Micractinium conductrix TaxID=554055 RepID=A0A2P6VA04_9CHLO|nr:2,4-dihydroxyhept-2-ene-1,7-dioic acid aldolase [Micractinium conductrix]|eukprot:PSC70905.1 2,4-dihydroxyhept-2-ene-1,7-dioic acid aldolase [Micractinium conductrix]